VTLPRFNSGRIGPADYSDWNRVMAAAEEVEAMPHTARSVAKETRPLYAKLTEAIPTSSWLLGYSGFKWVEVMASRNEPGAKWEWKALPSGLTWSGFAGGPAYAVSLGGASVGDIVELRRVPSMVGDAGPLGEVWFLVMPMTGGVSGGESGLVVSRLNPVPDLNLPGYTIQLFDSASSLSIATGSVVIAVNDFELASEVQVMVDTLSPGTKVLQPLPTNTPIFSLKRLPFTYGQPNEQKVLYGFTFANPYQIVC
jgi:hypothetical protein